MKIFIDTANIKEIKEAISLGVIDGVTTNPTLVSKEMRPAVRNPVHVLNAALIGADIATIPFPVIEQLIKHPLTDIGVNRFLEDYKKIPK